MKLTKEIKNRIDQYFDQIQAEELYSIATKKYGFEEETGFNLDDCSFSKVEKNFYSPDKDESLDDENSRTLPLAA